MISTDVHRQRNKSKRQLKTGTLNQLQGTGIKVRWTGIKSERMRDHGDQGISGARMDNRGRLGETARLQKPWRPGYIGSKDGQQWETGGDSEGPGRLQRPMRPGYIWSKDGRQWETVRDPRDYRDHGN